MESTESNPVELPNVRGIRMLEMDHRGVQLTHHNQRRQIPFPHITLVERRRRNNGRTLAFMVAGLVLSLSAQFGWRGWYPLGYGLVGAGIALWMVSRFDVFIETIEDGRICIARDLDRPDAESLEQAVSEKLSEHDDPPAEPR